MNGATMTNKKLLCLSGISIVVFTLILVVLFVFSTKSKMKTCKAYVSYVIFTSKNKFTFTGSVLLSMKDNKEGYVLLSGVVSNNGNDYYLFQYITIDYVKMSPKEYLFSIKKINQVKSDNTPDYLIISLHDVMGLSGKIPIYFYTNNENYILWGTLMSPVMSCVVRNVARKSH